jgi:transposase InsO family protein
MVRRRRGVRRPLVLRQRRRKKKNVAHIAPPPPPSRRRRQQGPVTDREIIEAFRTPGHPIAFSAPGAVARYFNISQERARDVLQEIDSYVLHREYKRPAQYNPYYVYKRRELIQTDLIDMRDLRAANDNTSFLLLLIDVFSRKVWVSPLERKTAVEVERALRQWLDNLPGRRKVKTIMHDAGTEFTNARVRALLAERGIEQRIALGTSKASYAERANKTIQVLLYKWLSDRETTRYIDQLDNIVKSYNARGHRSLQFLSPREADKPKNEKYVRGLNMHRVAKVRRKEPTLQLGDLVRVKTDSSKISSARRAYAEQYRGEYFTIMRINKRLPIPMYTLKSLDTGEIIQGPFYASELSRTKGVVFKVEQVLRQRKRRGKKEMYVKWAHFGPAWNEWIPEENITEVF